MNARDKATRMLYFNLVNDTAHFLVSSNDIGLVPGNALDVLKRPLACLWNEKSRYRRRYPCGKCEVCLAFKTKGKFLDISTRMFDPEMHEYVFFTLSLPKWPALLPVVDGCKNLGEILYWTPPLLSPGYRDGLRMPDILKDVKDVGLRTVESCFPDCQLGVVLFLHLADDFLQFSPHLHGVVCTTALGKSSWPLKQDSKGHFPDLAKAWRRIIGQGAMSVRDFETMLHERWAEGVGKIFENKLSKYRAGLIPGISTENIGYQFLTQHGHLVKNMGSVIQNAVLADGHCVDAKWMKLNAKTGEEDPAAAFASVMKYGLTGQMKRTEFRDLGGWMSSVVFRQGDRLVSCGKRDVLYKRLVQLHYAGKGVRRYQAKGLFGAALGGRGKAYNDAFVAAVNRGYPRTKRNIEEIGQSLLKVDGG